MTIAYTTTAAETDADRAQRIAVAIATAIDLSGQRTVRTGVHYDTTADTYVLRAAVGSSKTADRIFDLAIAAPGAIPALFADGRFIGLGGRGITSDTAPANIAIALLARITGYLVSGH